MVLKWGLCESGNRIQTYTPPTPYSPPHLQSQSPTLSEGFVIIVIIHVDSNVMCWNPLYGETIGEDFYTSSNIGNSSSDANKGKKSGWIFSAPSTPHFIAAELLKIKSLENIIPFVVIHSSSQSLQTKNAIVSIVDEISDISETIPNEIEKYPKRKRIVGMVGGCVLEASAFTIVNFENIFSVTLTTTTATTLELIISPSWKEESFEYKKVENGSNSQLFDYPPHHHHQFLLQREEKEIKTNEFYDRLVDQIIYRHKEGERVLNKISILKCKQIDFFETAQEITSSQEAAYDTIVSNLPRLNAIIMCGQPGGELEMATSKLINKILKKGGCPPPVLSVFDQKMCKSLKAGNEKYKKQLEEDLKDGKKIIFYAPNVRKSERIFLHNLVKDIRGEGESPATILTALITKPSWWYNSRQNTSPLSKLTLNSYRILFEPPDDSEIEKNVVRLI